MQSCLEASLQQLNFLASLWQNFLLDHYNAQDTKVRKSEVSSAKRAKIDKFQESWLKHWPWLEYDSESTSMFCGVCKTIFAAANDSTVFVSKGCKDFKTSALTRHALSKKHQSAVSKEKLAPTCSITAAISNVVTANKEGVLCSMKTAYFMFKEDLATSKHSALMDFLKIQQCPAACSSQYTYSHSHSVAEFHEVFCDVIQEEFLSKIRNSPYLSVIIDESTDISVHKKLIVYVKILNRAVAETHFLRNVVRWYCTNNN